MVTVAPWRGRLECISSFGPYLNASFFGNSSFLEPVWAHHSIPAPRSTMPQREGNLGSVLESILGSKAILTFTFAGVLPHPSIVEVHFGSP
jgi:hypothetical protein